MAGVVGFVGRLRRTRQGYYYVYVPVRVGRQLSPETVYIVYLYEAGMRHPFIYAARLYDHGGGRYRVLVPKRIGVLLEPGREYTVVLRPVEHVVEH